MSSNVLLQFDNDWIHIQSSLTYNESMTLGTDVCAVIKKEMARQGLSLRETAKKMGRSHHWLGTKLRGTSPISTDDIEEIAKVFELDPVKLLIDATQVS